MATRIEIAGWSAEGLRCPDHSILFEREDTVDKAVLIQMPNGTGKTTTLTLLRAALSGEMQEESKWPASRIGELAKRSDDSTSGHFQVELLLNKKRLSIELEFDFEFNTVTYFTNWGTGKRQGFHPPASVSQFFRSGFVNFIAFDGELAEQLLSRDHTDAANAIQDLFGLHLFRSISEEVNSFWESKAAQAGTRQSRGLNRRKNRVEKLRKLNQQRREERDALEAKRSDVARSLEQTKRKFEGELQAQSQHAAALREAEAQYQEARTEVERLSSEGLQICRSPAALSQTFGQTLMDLKANLDRVKLPESAAKEFFEELAQEPTCVCGRAIDDSAMAAIRERAATYMGAEEMGFLNFLKSDIDAFIGGNPGAISSRFVEHLGGLQQAVKKRERYRTQRDLVERQAIGDDPEFKAVKAKIDNLVTDLNHIDFELSEYSSKDDTRSDEATKGIGVLERRYNTAEEEFAKAAHAHDLKARKDILQQVLDSAHAQAKDRLATEIVAMTNDRIAELMPYNHIRVSSIADCLELEGQEGGSVGETLCVAYSFLSTLFAASAYELPFVVDSPAGSIDLRVREEIAKLVPSLSHQFIAFIISSEREKFVAPLVQCLPEEVRLLTIYRVGMRTITARPGAQDSVTETADGVVVDGREFFVNFHADKE